MIPRPSLRIPLALLLLAVPLRAQLDLPAPTKEPRATKKAPKPRAGEKPAVEEVLELPAGAPASPAPVPAGEAGPEAAAEAILAGLEGGHPRDVGPALERLLALGPAALPAARARMADESGAVLLAAGRLCLVGGASADRAAVAARLQRRLPPECAAPLLEELLARDPVLATPEYLVGLLEHPTSAMRAAVRRELDARVSVDFLAALAPVLASDEVSARGAALDLVARVDDPGAWNLLASRLGDPSSRLAQRAVTLLAGLEGAKELLLRTAFPDAADAEWTRARAHAVLALVQREETRQELLLREEHITPLRAGLVSTSPLVAGACAVGLARAGFRVGASRAGAWLDRDVVHQLVRAATGAEFHSDFSTLEQPAQRALTLLTGERFGQDGDAWRRWWLARAETFHARHGVIELEPGDAALLEVAFDDAQGRTRRLVGPALEPGPVAEGTLHLDERSAERLRALLEEEGVFDMRRLPGGTRVGGESSLRVALGLQEKRFSYARGSVDWFDRVLAGLEELAAENAWQARVDPAVRADPAAWAALRERWATLPPRERELELKGLLLEALRREGGAGRDGALADLRELYARPGVPDRADFETLLALLAGEPGWGPRAADLLELARIAAGTPGTDVAADGTSAQELLLAHGIEHLAAEADQVLERIARALGPEELRRLALDPRPRARALAAAGLVRTGDEHGLLRGLFFDPSHAVRLATLEALQSAPPELLREELLQCARGGPADLRALALTALARHGGKDVRDLAMAALGDEDPGLNLVGAEALAELASPESASFFASLLARGPSSPLFASARRGLLRLGDVGTNECLRMAENAGTRARREAALLLGEALRAEAAPLLMELLAKDPRDSRVAWELSVLSGVDLASEENPRAAAEAWWELVVHDDPLAWFLAAVERGGRATPPAETLRGGPDGALTAEGARFLLEVCALPWPHLVERATRELERGLAEEFARPSTGEWTAFREELEEAVRARFGE